MPRAARYSRQIGNSRENRLGAELETRGYIPFYSRGSRGTDIVALCVNGRRPHLMIAVSRPSYGAVREPFEKLRAATPVPGSVLMLAREMKKAGRDPWWRVYLHEDAFYDNLDVALEVASAL